MRRGILIVDDDGEFRSELAGMLDDYDTTEASGGGEALSILSSPNDIEIVLLDIRMPGMDGLETLKRIRELDSEIGVIMLTGFSTKDAAIDSLKNRADDYLEKPADIDNVRAAVERLLLSKGRGGPDGVEGDPSLRSNRIRSFLKKNSGKKTTLAEAADLVFLSPKYLSRYFKENTGRNFRDYKMELKIKEAKKLLSGSGLSVSSVSQKLGYSNPESFSRIFKKHAGVSPSEYRSKNKAENR